ncbi:hypothetical protein STEG23_000823 [Scotinomys teguina]
MLQRTCLKPDVVDTVGPGTWHEQEDHIADVNMQQAKPVTGALRSQRQENHEIEVILLYVTALVVLELSL